MRCIMPSGSLGELSAPGIVLEYITTEIKMREYIQAASYKGEAFNDFNIWIFFFTSGGIA